MTLAALDNVALIGSVVEIAGKADRATGTFTVEIALPDDPRLRSGQIGDAAIVARGGGAAVIAVPPTALFAARAGEAFVYVVDRTAKRVRLRRVRIGDADGETIAVTAGLQRGEWVATSRIDRLKDGMAITPTTAR